MEKLFAGLIFFFVCTLTAVTQAVEVAPYFAWEIKNPDSYTQSNLAVIEIDKVNTTAHKNARIDTPHMEGFLLQRELRNASYTLSTSLTSSVSNGI